MARNTNQAPVVRRPELDALRDAVINSIAPIDNIAAAVDELLQRQQILEAAYLSLARDVEYILGAEGEELTEEASAAAKEVWDSDSLEKQFYDPATAFMFAAAEDDEGRFDDDGGYPPRENPTPGITPDAYIDESPEEEAARLIAEAQATTAEAIRAAEAANEEAL
jgi:hypothetical protein